MARRRTRSHLEMREQFDAAERRKDEDEPDAEEEEESDEEEDEEEGEEGEAEGEAEEGDEDEGDEDDEDALRKKKKKKPVAKAVKEVKPKPKRTRAPKIIRMKALWAVFNNSNQRVATYEYPKRKEAEEHAERLRTEKKSTFFVQPVKEPIEEKKEKEKE